MENSRCNCGNSQSNWGWGQNQAKCKGYDNYKNEGHKYNCYCFEEKENCGCEKETSQCGCSSNNKNHNNYGCGAASQNSYYGWL